MAWAGTRTRHHRNGYVVQKDATAKRLTATGAEFVPTFSQEFGGFIKQETTSSPRSSNRLPSRQNDRRAAKKLRQPAQSDGTAIVRSNFAYVGCRTTRERNARGKGISVFRIDETGQWQLVAVEETRPNPSFLTVEGTGRFLYAVHGDGTDIFVSHWGRWPPPGHRPFHLGRPEPCRRGARPDRPPPDRNQSSLRFACRSLFSR